MSKHVLMVLAVALLLGAGSTAWATTVFQDGGDRLVALQNNDGGWDWSPADDGNPNNASSLNTVGPIAMGLAKAYRMTGYTDAGMLAALGNAGGLLLNKINTFSPSDGYLAVELDSIFGGTTYTAHVKTNFYDVLAAGEYDRNGVDTNYDTAGYVSFIDTVRAGTNLAAWDIGIGLVAAGMVGADTAAWIAGTKTEIDQLDGDTSYDVLGLAGAIYGLASVGENFDPTAGEHAAASNLADLAAILASYQIDMGGFTWDYLHVIANDDNESIQNTAYAILALNEVDRAGYLPAIQGAGSYLMSAQLGTGGWENSAGGGENNEVTGEALWAVNAAVPEPMTMACLFMGVTGLAGYIRKRRMA